MRRQPTGRFTRGEVRGRIYPRRPPGGICPCGRGLAKRIVWVHGVDIAGRGLRSRKLRRDRFNLWRAWQGVLKWAGSFDLLGVS